jgi:hypothetical protein
MTKVNGHAPACKVSRQVRLLVAASPGQPWAAVEITTGKDTAVYAVKPVRSDIGGRGFEVVKQGEVDLGESGWYQVLVHGEESACTCKGHLRWGHCKHCWALSRLVQRELL